MRFDLLKGSLDEEEICQAMQEIPKHKIIRITPQCSGGMINQWGVEICFMVAKAPLFSGKKQPHQSVWSEVLDKRQIQSQCGRGMASGDLARMFPHFMVRLVASSCCSKLVTSDGLKWPWQIHKTIASLFVWRLLFQ